MGAAADGAIDNDAGNDAEIAAAARRRTDPAPPGVSCPQSSRRNRPISRSEAPCAAAPICSPTDSAPRPRSTVPTPCHPVLACTARCNDLDIDATGLGEPLEHMLHQAERRLVKTGEAGHAPGTGVEHENLVRTQGIENRTCLFDSDHHAVRGVSSNCGRKRGA